MIRNLSPEAAYREVCPACDNTGLLVLAGTYRVGKRVMQPQATGCIWCERGADKFRKFPGMLAEYTPADIDKPVPEPDLSDPRVRQACKDAFTEWQRQWRLMQAATERREAELRHGAKQTASTQPEGAAA